MSSFIVNGKSVTVEKNMSLLRYLRDVERLTSVKDGCSEGACGTCTIVIDGEAVKACTYTTGSVDGKTILTTEGLTDREKDIYTYAFGEAGAVQCGFCIPGMVMCAKALLDKNLNPTEKEIRHAIRNNICRCTGYVKIVKAIEIAAEILRGDGIIRSGDVKWKIGERVHRVDVRDKVTGTGKYPDDLYVEGMLHASCLRSKYPRAKVLSLDITQAEKQKGIVKIFTAKDVPGNKVVGHLTKDWNAIVDVGEITRFLGDPVALIVGETIEDIESAKKFVKVEYEPLPYVSSPAAAMAQGAPLVHENAPGNLAVEKHVSRGNAEEAIEKSDVVYSAHFSTPYTEHAFLEPECALSVPKGDDGVKIYSTDQGVYDTLHETAPFLGLPYEKVEVENCLVGGGFGGKEDVTVQHLSALAAYLLKRPVKMKLTRAESLLFHPKRHPMEMDFTVGVDKKGKIQGVKAKVIADTGAYMSLGGPVLERACTHASGPYNYQNFKIDGYAYYTNNPPAGAFRGFGVTQTCFGIENMLNTLARKVGISEWDIRYLNAIRPGQELPNGQIADDSTGLAETLLAVKDKYDRAKIKGIACAMKNAGVGVGLPDWGRVKLIIEGGKVHVHCAGSCIGQGLWTVLKMITADITGLDESLIEVERASTNDPDSGTTSGSRHTTVTGEAARQAAHMLKDALEGKTLSDLEGEEYYAEYLAKTDKMGSPVPHPVSHVAYGYATQLCILNDDGTIEEMVAAHDVGRAINPTNVEGQIEGGVVMGMGYALRERYRVEDCRPLEKYGSLGLFRADELPKITSIIVEKPGLKTSSGAIGIGEITSIPTAPAISNAYYHWDHVLHHELPLESTPYLIRPSEKKVLAKGKRLFVNPGVRCIGCLECVRTCSEMFYKEKDRRYSALRVEEKNGEWKPVTCIQCGKCAKACPQGAIKQLPSGVWTIDRKLCTGCGLCQKVCPVHVMVTSPITGQTGKCIACGKCVQSCPMDVLQIASSQN